MKLIQYQLLTEVNRGTQEKPDIEARLNAVAIKCSEEKLEASLALAQAEAYNGEVAVEDLPDEEAAPTAAEKLAALEERNELLAQQVAALSSQLDFQEECLVELAGMLYA